jgi:acyl-CoA reductase-like NAD-dependent aldehyde dehydrogenase
MVSEQLQVISAEGEQARQRELQALFASQRNATRQPAPTIKARQARLLALERALIANRDKLAAAISEDFGHRSVHETQILEIYTTVAAARYAAKHLPRWARPEKRPASLYFIPARNRVICQPLGVVGIVAPFNFPVYLSIGPLVGALAAGNRVLLKLSEYTPRTGLALAEVLGVVFAPGEVAVVNGGREISAAFCKLPFDHLLFTGSPRVGRLVMQAASANLTPVTLELGGKSPVLIDDHISWAPMVKRIMAGKTLNAGQTCVGPDYVLLPRGTEHRFARHAETAIAELYPLLNSNPDYSSIASEAHYTRLTGLLADARRQGARLIELNSGGGELSASDRRIAPTLVLDVKPSMLICQDEIFGPILPLIPYESLDDAIEYIGQRPRPLALYCFSRRRAFIREVLRRTASGSVGINAVMRQAAQPELPFGGVGESGFGRYHGQDGFLLFSNQRSVTYEGTYTSFTAFYPPYGRLVQLLLKFMLKPSRHKRS